jgi:hypothetical protein
MEGDSMSGSGGLSTDPLSDAERVDVRRFCGYPSYGAGASGFQSWRFFEAYGTLEFRLSNMSGSEYQVVRQKLAALYSLEQGIPNIALSLDTNEAAAWKRNPSEITDRIGFFENWCRGLASFIGVPPGPGLVSQASIVI